MNTRRFLSLFDVMAAGLLRGLPMILLVGLCAVAAWRAAGWMWQAFPPAGGHAKILEPGDPVSPAIARHWFGVVPVVESAARDAGAMAPQMASANIKLLGLIAGGRKTVAMLQVDQETYEVFLGESFANTLRFKSHGLDFVVIESNGADLRIALPFSPPSDASGSVNPQMQNQVSSPQRRPNFRANRP